VRASARNTNCTCAAEVNLAEHAGDVHGGDPTVLKVSFLGVLASDRKLRQDIGLVGLNQIHDPGLGVDVGTGMLGTERRGRERA